MAPEVKLTWVAVGPFQSAALAATGKVEGPKFDTGDGERYLRIEGGARAGCWCFPL